MPGDTIGDLVAENASLYVNCEHPQCQHTKLLDLTALIDRLGRDHGAMHDDLVRKFRCTKCEREGRPRRAVFFTLVPNYRRIDARRISQS
jgi:hypothetical protein